MSAWTCDSVCQAGIQEKYPIYRINITRIYPGCRQGYERGWGLVLVFEGSANGGKACESRKCRCERFHSWTSIPVREDDCTRVLCQSWQGYSWVLLTAVPCLWHLCSQPCKHRVCVCVSVYLYVCLSVRVCARVSLRYVLSLSTRWAWKDESCSHLSAGWRDIQVSRCTSLGSRGQGGGMPRSWGPSKAAAL